MGVRSEVDQGTGNVVVYINGRFDFQIHDEFRRAYAEAENSGSSFTVDLNGAEYMDSSALGMLLMLKEHAGASGKVEIVNSKAEVLNVLKIANFDKLFDIH
ncbi:MAG: STAS domain-containing protein [Pseudomonadota bacterium]